MSKNRYMKTIAAMNKILVYCHEHYSECDSKGQSELAEVNQAAKDALALLKEQEAKPPAIMQDIEGIWSTCSMCGYKLRSILAMKMDTYFPKFCPECGQAVKWE